MKRSERLQEAARALADACALAPRIAEFKRAEQMLVKPAALAGRMSREDMEWTIDLLCEGLYQMEPGAARRARTRVARVLRMLAST